jgi:hypothetical protein
MIELESAKEELKYHIDNLKSAFGTKASSAKILSIVHDCPCPMKCVSEIKNAIYNSKIDRIYIEQHEYVKKKIIQALLINFRLTNVKSEYKINNGTIDIAIVYDKILVNYHQKTICIEVKSGQSIDLFQIERYLYESDLLVVVRVPTRDVVSIHQQNVATELIAGIMSAIEKIQLLGEVNLVKVQGDWCRGCKVDCEFQKEASNYNHTAKLEFEKFIKNVNAVTEETIRIVKGEMGTI